MRLFLTEFLAPFLDEEHRLHAEAIDRYLQKLLVNHGSLDQRRGVEVLSEKTSTPERFEGGMANFILFVSLLTAEEKVMGAMEKADKET